MKKVHVGARFGRLLVIKREQLTGKEPRWMCRCDCGNEKSISYEALRSLNTQSCGCLRKERSKNRMMTHGLTASGEFRIWANMKNRCLNRKNFSFQEYGGRGISVCEKWSNDFQAFLSDMGKRPSPRHSIERRDNSGNYSPENCYWATPVQQANNRRSNAKYEYNGQKLTARQLMEFAHPTVSYRCLRSRLTRWTVEKSLTTPV